MLDTQKMQMQVTPKLVELTVSFSYHLPDTSKILSLVTRLCNISSPVGSAVKDGTFGRTTLVQNLVWNENYITLIKIVSA